MTNNIDIVKSMYVAINSNDALAAAQLLDPAILRVEFKGSPNARIYHGIEEFKGHLTQGRSTWAEGACSPEQFIVEGDKIVVLVHVRVRLKDKTDWIDGRVADAYALRNGKITEMHSFFTKEEAFAWAGIKK